jgi:ribonucleoside-triphosphate reductase
MQCNDCKEELVDNDEYMPYTVGLNEYFKCKECYEIDPVLRNFQECEIYSRVVGYIRPVSQWNNGKKEEYTDRKVYNIPIVKFEGKDVR